MNLKAKNQEIYIHFRCPYEVIPASPNIHPPNHSQMGVPCAPLWRWPQPLWLCSPCTPGGGKPQRDDMGMSPEKRGDDTMSHPQMEPQSWHLGKL